MCSCLFLSLDQKRGYCPVPSNFGAPESNLARGATNPTNYSIRSQVRPLTGLTLKPKLSQVWQLESSSSTSRAFPLWCSEKRSVGGRGRVGGVGGVPKEDFWQNQELWSFPLYNLNVVYIVCKLHGRNVEARESPNHGMCSVAVAIFRLWRLFICVGDKWWFYQNSMSPQSIWVVGRFEFISRFDGPSKS